MVVKDFRALEANLQAAALIEFYPPSSLWQRDRPPTEFAAKVLSLGILVELQI